MKASKISVSGEFGIRLDFSYNDQTILQIRKIMGARWSRLLKIWHIPYNLEAFNQLQGIFPDVEYERRSSGTGTSVTMPEVAPGAARLPVRDVNIEVEGRAIRLSLPKNQADIHLIRSIRFSRWDMNRFCWIIPNYPGNLELIREYFGKRINELIVHQEIQYKTRPGNDRTVKSGELLMIKTSRGRIRLVFGYNTTLIGFIKKIPFHNWDARNGCWTVPWSEKIAREIHEAAKSSEMAVIYEEEAEAKKGVSRISREEIPDYRPCPDAYRNKLVELRYSSNTARVYCSMMEEFINFYPQTDLSQVDDRMITAFLQYLVVDRKVSPSYQNQSINAIKFYYERLLGLPRKVYHFERPRGERKLPVVLNEDEVTRAIRLTKNIKHKAIIMVTYSAGLRLSEVLNLKLSDIDSSRMQVFVRQAKGNKDRYTILSKKALALLRLYIREARPKEYLFEGIHGGKYSESSVHSVVEAAYRRAGIKKPATVHTLRHCFGTHLLENGTDLRYIQALMGHSSSKTTEIYTHITTRGFNQIESPLDKLEI